MIAFLVNSIRIECKRNWDKSAFVWMNECLIHGGRLLCLSKKICDYLLGMVRQKARKNWFSFLYFKNNKSYCKNKDKYVPFCLPDLQIKAACSYSAFVWFQIFVPSENATCGKKCLLSYYYVRLFVYGWFSNRIYKWIVHNQGKKLLGEAKVPTRHDQN